MIEKKALLKYLKSRFSLSLLDGIESESEKKYLIEKYMKLIELRVNEELLSSKSLNDYRIKLFTLFCLRYDKKIFELLPAERLDYFRISEVLKNLERYCYESLTFAEERFNNNVTFDINDYEIKQITHYFDLNKELLLKNDASLNYELYNYMITLINYACGITNVFPIKVQNILRERN